MTVAALSVLVWSDPVGGRPGLIAVLIVVLLTALYHAFVRDRRIDGWSLAGPPGGETAI
ncbi:hypothetical protein [Novosphingobium lentum]|uniref:hypothetical protein n=1 Tax=Novosphingobium lentum TaxID=145287 RepID=UPI000A930A15|nr:hypothetical protein [Novosphingobium lentum]